MGVIQTVQEVLVGGSIEQGRLQSLQAKVGSTVAATAKEGRTRAYIQGIEHCRYLDKWEHDIKCILYQWDRQAVS